MEESPWISRIGQLAKGSPDATLLVAKPALPSQEENTCTCPVSNHRADSCSVCADLGPDLSRSSWSTALSNLQGAESDRRLGRLPHHDMTCPILVSSRRRSTGSDGGYSQRGILTGDLAHPGPAVRADAHGSCPLIPPDPPTLLPTFASSQSGAAIRTPWPRSASAARVLGRCSAVHRRCHFRSARRATSS